MSRNRCLLILVNKLRSGTDTFCHLLAFLFFWRTSHKVGLAPKCSLQWHRLAYRLGSRPTGTQKFCRLCQILTHRKSMTVQHLMNQSRHLYGTRILLHFWNSTARPSLTTYFREIQGTCIGVLAGHFHCWSLYGRDFTIPRRQYDSPFNRSLQHLKQWWHSQIMD